MNVALNSKAQVIVTGKSTSDAAIVEPFPPDPNSATSTISTVEREIREAGGRAVAIPVDTRDHESVQRMIDTTVEASEKSPTSNRS